MRRDPAEILKAALELPIEGRAALTDSLLESLDQEVDEDAETAWQQEVRRRLAELDSNLVSPLPWDDVRMRLMATLRDEKCRAMSAQG
jgi:putative addiction module component (TIGR02574 family)